MSVSTPSPLTEGPVVASWPGWPSFTPEETERVAEVLRSGRVNYHTGQEGRQFEREYAAHLGCRGAVAMANGTLTLDLILRALGIGPGDEVVVTPRSFMASASCVAMAGATPVFADVDRESQNLTAESIARALTPKTKAVLLVHLAGWPAEMDTIVALCRSHGALLIEDCAQAHGASYRGRPVGTLGIVSSWSFCQDKIITTGGEGGLVATDDESLDDALWSLKDHGKSREATYRTDHPPGYRWLHESFGTNARMTEMQAALGRIQLRRLPEWSQARAANAAALREALSPIPNLRVPWPPDHVVHAWYKFNAFLDPGSLCDGWSRERIADEISARGVPCMAGTCGELYREQAFVQAGLGPNEPLPVAQELGETSLMLQVHPTLTPDDMRRAGEVVSWVVGQATR
ncbi:MAG: DegT/DnrJ/EryC1/StrS aminotransferase family protein [Fimbriimonadaceae bacterium]|nr:DegT/DnrJ/EryC1/StrS aminotransferase family protein [Fimbriimonadaceae bacterium]QYK59253.1 MAG: DegT/DnrJ/EryC1/StrS aminotransferase family protein [Fimbriimonadaceae bacterium]